MRTPYDRKYIGQEYYWGKKPSKMCDMVIEIIRSDAEYRPKLLDLGCGEGRNAVYFAGFGFEVVGLDLSKSGLEKTEKLAEDTNVHVKTIQADILTYNITEVYDIVFSTGTLHYLPPNGRLRHFQNYKEQTSANGINVLSVFVEKPFIPKAPDAETTAHPYRSGELMSYYWDWEILYSVEEIFDCLSGEIPHKHAINRIIARRR